MKNYSIEDFQENLLVLPLTQGVTRIEDKLVKKSNELECTTRGIIETRRDMLNNEFDKELLLMIIEMASKWEACKNNIFWFGTLHASIEALTRDVVLDYMVEDFAKSIQMKLELFDGNVELLAGHIEKYFTCGKITPMAQTWREVCEENEKGMIIYYEPKPNKSN